MNELQRMQYLDALGVDMFVPRFTMPGALASELCELPVRTVETGVDHRKVGEHAYPVSSEEVSSPPASAGVGSGNLIANLFGEEAKPIKTKPTKTKPENVQPDKSNIVEAEQGSNDPRASNVSTNPEQATNEALGVESASGGSHASIAEGESEKPLSPADVVADVQKSTTLQTTGSSETQANKIPQSVDSAQSSESNATDEPVTFSLSIWNSEQALVLDSVTEGQALPTDALLKNILIQAGLLNTVMPRAEILKWPPFNLPNIDNGFKASQDWITPYLEGKLQFKEKSILLFGADALGSILGSNKEFERVQYTTVELDTLHARALVLPSLAELLYEPSLKKRVWLALSSYLAG